MQTGQKDHFVAGLKRRSRYLPAIHERLSLESLPKELAHLPLVESSFNTKATSKVGAAGVWQIMPHIGRQFFTVSKHLDERLSPLKATRVATALLKENYQILNKNWSLAVTAYNHGPSHVRRIFKKTGSHSLGQMILKNKNPRFGFASENFYAEFLAATYASEYQNEVFDSFEKPASLAFDIYQLPPGVQLTASKLLHLTGLSSKEFIEFNFDLKKALSSKHFLPKNFRFYLPEGKAIKFGHNLARWMKKTSLPPKLLSLLESNRRFSIQI